ncbi:MAG: PAS domain S-box protein [Ferruginibacter sp.]
MELAPDIFLQKRMIKWSAMLAILVLVIASAVLIGWQFDMLFLRRPIPNLVAMNPVTASAFILAAVALLLLAPENTSRQRGTAGRILAALVLFVGLAKITALVSGLNIHIDYLLFPDKITSTRTAGSANGMAPNTAICFILAGLSLLLLHVETGNKKLPVHFTALLMGMTGLLSILGYLYKVEAFYSVLRYISMAIHSAICFLLLAIAILFANPGKGIMKDFTSVFSGSITARLLVPAAIIIPTVLGLLRLHGNWMGLYSNEFGVAIFALSTIIAFLCLIWYNTILLNRRDLQKRSAEDELKASMQQISYFAEIIEKTSDGVVSFTPDFKIKSWNKGAEVIYGLKREEVIGKSSREVFKQDYTIAELDSLREQLIRQGYWNGEFTQYRADGSAVSCLLSTTELKDETGTLTGYVVIAKDITVQKMENEKLKISEERFRLLVNNVKDQAIFMLDDLGRVASWNTAAQNMQGYTAEEVIGKTTELFYTEDDIKTKVPATNLSMARKNGHFEKKGWRVRKDGSVFWANVGYTALYDDKGKQRGYSKVIKDITEGKKAEEQIAYLARLLEDSGDAIFSTDVSFCIKSWNKAAELFFGYSAAEVINQPVADIVRPQISDEEREELRDNMRKMGGWRGEVVYLKKDGTPLVVLISNAATRNEKEEIDGFVTICRDISTRKKLEEKLKRSNEELEAFSYSVSHDLRAPLRAIIGFSSILEEDYGSLMDDEAKRITHVIKSNTQKMGLLIDDLLNFSRMGRHEIMKAVINCNEMINDIIKELHPENSDKIKWIIHPLPPVTGDLNMMRQVWLNLISNAIKYSGKTAQPVIEIGSFKKQGQQPVFFIKDNGVGFDQQYAGKLFKVFQRLHSVYEFEGTGVGLAIIEKIISKHGGTVWAEGKPGDGACFYFSIPESLENINETINSEYKNIHYEL